MPGEVRIVSVSAKIEEVQYVGVNLISHPFDEQSVGKERANDVRVPFGKIPRSFCIAQGPDHVRTEQVNKTVRFLPTIDKYNRIEPTTLERVRKPHRATKRFFVVKLDCPSDP